MGVETQTRGADPVPVTLDGRSLSLDELIRVARSQDRVELSRDAVQRMSVSRVVCERALARGDRVYGLTTGVGARKDTCVNRVLAGAFNRSLILNSRVGTGPPAAVEVVRATMVCLLNLLLSGLPGVRAELALVICRALNERRHPILRTRGSVGQADLAPLADLANGLFVSGGSELAPGEGLALIDNNAFATALTAVAIHDCKRLLDALDVVGALELEAFVANLDIVHVLAEQRPFPGLLDTLGRLRALLAGSSLTEPGAARNLQDPLCYRCLPQVHGAARDALQFALGQLAIELNAAQNNPLVSLEEDRLVSLASFEILPLATAVDSMRVALAPVLTCAVERMIKLLHPAFSGLRGGLAAGPDAADDGFNEFAVAGQAVAAEARLLAQPVSYELVSTSGAEGIEDRTTMAPLGARRLSEMVALAHELAAMELAVATRALLLRAPTRLGSGAARVQRMVTDLLGPQELGAPVPADLEPLQNLVGSDALAAVADECAA
ncbi:MAG TPA: aromatic amino acid lyase [Solirubrobacteraceae bacterium]|nr:aromatic amino acid lyase [Solirubrobacteraceae bacterium]